MMGLPQPSWRRPPLLFPLRAFRASMCIVSIIFRDQLIMWGCAPSAPCTLSALSASWPSLSARARFDVFAVLSGGVRGVTHTGTGASVPPAPTDPDRYRNN
jgi:hypothetical protein